MLVLYVGEMRHTSEIDDNRFHRDILWMSSASPASQGIHDVSSRALSEPFLQTFRNEKSPMEVS